MGFAVDKRRFRANLYLEPRCCPGLLRRRASGSYSADRRRRPSVVVLERDPRCKMITLDPDTGHSSPEILREVAQAHDGMAGIYCAATVEGTVGAGDEVRLE